MAQALALVPGFDGTRTSEINGVTVDLLSPAMALTIASPEYDLLVVSGLDVDGQQQIAAALQESPGWRLVPVLYLVPESQPGITFPGTFRPEVDGIVRGDLDSPKAAERIADLARDGVGAAEPLAVGAIQLDPVRRLLQVNDDQIILTDRESEILAILLASPNATVPSNELIERGWGVGIDRQHLQNLRRHMSNIRRKLEHIKAEDAVETVRGTGYRFIALAS